MQTSSVQRWLVIPFILLLVGAALWLAMRESGSPPPGAATVAAPPMAQIASMRPLSGGQGLAVMQQRQLVTRRAYEGLVAEYSADFSRGAESTSSSFISGVVRDRDNGLPIPDAFVIAWAILDHDPKLPPFAPKLESPTAIPAGTLVDADVNGVFRIGPLAAGNYVLEAYHEGGQLLPWTPEDGEWPIALRPGEELSDVELYLYEGHTVTFKAVNAVTGDPIKGVRVLPVQIHVSADLARFKRVSVYTLARETDEHGEVTHEGLFGGKTTLDVSAPGHYLANEKGGRTSERPSVILSADSCTMEHTLALTLIPSIRARILMPDGTPVSGAEVAWRPGNPRDFRPVWHRALVEEMVPVDESGVFTFLPPAALDGFFGVRAKGYPLALSRPVQFTESIPTELTVQLEVPAKVEARVTMPNGEPARRAMVTIKPAGSYSPAGIRYIHEFTADTDQWSLKGLCDDEGVAVLGGLSTGQYMIQAEIEGLAPSRTRFLRVQSGETESVVLRLGNAES